MKVFLFWHGEKRTPERMLQALHKNHHRVVYFVGSKEQWPEEPSEIVFHDHNDAWNGKSAPALAGEHFTPPAQELLEQLHTLETRILTMMNKRFDWMCVDERRHLYYQILAYWQYILDKYQPEVLIFSYIPHTVYDFIVYELALRRNIKTITFNDTWTGERSLVYTNFWQGSDALRAYLAENETKNITLDDLPADMQEYYRTQTDPERDATPISIKEWRKRYSFFTRTREKVKMVIAAAKDLSLFEKGARFILKQFKSNLKKEYERLQAAPDFKKPYVYVPLQYQPECSTSSLGGVFADQILMVETLVAALPEGWRIYVKEHPKQWLPRGLNYFSARYEGYYRRLAALPNVFIVSPATDTFSLIQKAKAVATVTGTPGWEALVRGVPALTFGCPWYRDVPGLFRVDSTDGCREAFEKIAGGFRVPAQNIFRYLKSLDEACIPAYTEILPSRPVKNTPEENADIILQAILKIMEK
jgi:hypothetical protein